MMLSTQLLFLLFTDNFVFFSAGLQLKISGTNNLTTLCQCESGLELIGTGAC